MKTVQLGDVATVDRKGVNPESIPPDTIYLGLEHIERGGRIIGHSTVGGAQLTSTKFRFTSEHVLFGKLRPNLGKVSRPHFPGVCSTDILPLRPSKDLDRGYLAHYLAQPSMVDFAASRTSGANLPRLSPTVLASFPLPLPELPEQQRIAAILDQAEAIRAKRRQVLTHLDSLAHAAFDDMFGIEPWSSTLGEAVEVQIGPFGSLLHKADYVTDGVPLINPMHIRDGALQPDSSFATTEAKAESLALYRLKPGDVVLGRRGEMGRAGVVGNEHAGMICGTGSVILRPRDIDSSFLHSAVTSHRMKTHFERASLGATMPNLNATIVKAAPLPSPTAISQKKFSGRIAAIKRSTVLAQRALAADDELFASLQSRAFRGEL